MNVDVTYIENNNCCLNFAILTGVASVTLYSREKKLLGTITITVLYTLHVLCWYATLNNSKNSWEVKFVWNPQNCDCGIQYSWKFHFFMAVWDWDFSFIIRQAVFTIQFFGKNLSLECNCFFSNKREIGIYSVVKSVREQKIWQNITLFKHEMEKMHIYLHTKNGDSPPHFYGAIIIKLSKKYVPSL